MERAVVEELDGTGRREQIHNWLRQHSRHLLLVQLANEFAAAIEMGKGLTAMASGDHLEKGVRRLRVIQMNSGKGSLTVQLVEGMSWRQRSGEPDPESE